MVIIHKYTQKELDELRERIKKDFMCDFWLERMVKFIKKTIRRDKNDGKN